MTHLPQSNSNILTDITDIIDITDNTNITNITNITNNKLINFDSNITDVTNQLININAELKDFAHETELSFIKGTLELTNLQKELLQLKYDLLQDTNTTLITKNKAMTDQLKIYTCSICLTNAKACILEPCGHFVCCIPCISMLSNALCPICRTQCDYYIKVFNS